MERFILLLITDNSGGAVHGAAEGRAAPGHPPRDAHGGAHGPHRAPDLPALRQDELPAGLALRGHDLPGGPRPAARNASLNRRTRPAPPCGGEALARVPKSTVPQAGSAVPPQRHAAAPRLCLAHACRSCWPQPQKGEDRPPSRTYPGIKGSFLPCVDKKYDLC